MKNVAGNSAKTTTHRPSMF